MTNLRFLFILSLVWALSSASSFGQLTGITPNNGDVGQDLATTISSNGIFIQGFSPNGNIYEIYLKKGNEIIYLYDQWSFNAYPTEVIDANTAISGIDIPLYASTGVYDLHLTTLDPSWPWFPSPYQYFVLPAAFTVNPLDGFISGNLYKDLNRNGSKDPGEPNIQGGHIRLLPGNSTHFTDASGNYQIPVYNGNYSVRYSKSAGDMLYPTNNIDTLFMTVNNNNSTGNDFGVNGALLTVSPDVLIKGDTMVHTITANKPIFRLGLSPSSGNVAQFVVSSTPQITLNVGTMVTVLDSFTIQASIPVPINATEASGIDFRLTVLTNGVYTTHYLRQQLSVVSPPACAAPDSTWAKFITASSFRANWTPVPGAFRYQVYYKVGGTPTWTQRSVAGNKTFMGIQNLNCGTNYRWKVRTVCQTPSGNIRSVWTPVKVTTTLSCEAHSGDRNMLSDVPAIEVYPNPANERIIIEPGFEISAATTVDVYNLAGKRMLSEIFEEPNESGSFEMDVSSLNSGMYFIRINGMTSKFIVQRD